MICFFGWLAGQVMKLGLQGQMGTFGVLMGSEGGGGNGPFGGSKMRRNGKSEPTLQIGPVFL